MFLPINLGGTNCFSNFGIKKKMFYMTESKIISSGERKSFEIQKKKKKLQKVNTIKQIRHFPSNKLSLILVEIAF